MNKRKFFHFMIILVFVSMVFACKIPSATPTENVTPAAPVESQTSASPGEGATSVKLTFVTGSDGTADNPVFELFSTTGSILFTTILDKPGDLQPNQTDVYEFSVPHPFCQITGYQLTKPASSGSDDAWLPTEIYIELDGKVVFFHRLFSDLGAITEGSPRSGNWSGIELYIQECGN